MGACWSRTITPQPEAREQEGPGPTEASPSDLRPPTRPRLRRPTAPPWGPSLGTHAQPGHRDQLCGGRAWLGSPSPHTAELAGGLRGPPRAGRLSVPTQRHPRHGRHASCPGVGGTRRWVLSQGRPALSLASCPRLRHRQVIGALQGDCLLGPLHDARHPPARGAWAPRRKELCESKELKQK